MNLIYKLYKIQLFSILGIFRVLLSILKEGVNLTTLLAWAARTHGNKMAVVDENETLTYSELYSQTLDLSAAIKQRYPKTKLKAAIIAKNSAELLKLIFALSRSGADVYLLNVEIKPEQFQRLQDRFVFDLVICDNDFYPVLESAACGAEFLKMSELDTLSSPDKFRLKRAYRGQLIVLSGGSTGDPKAAARKPSLFHFLNPFFALLRDVELDKYRSVYVATPIYHGFGVAAVITGMALGATLFLRRRFDAAEACAFVAKNNIEVITLVPLMLKRMLQHSAESLAAVQAFLTGGAPLSPDVVVLTKEKAGNKLFNLYGTTEAGFCILAKPEDLKCSIITIGKPVKGVKLHILDKNDRPVKQGEIGRLCVKAAWSVKKSEFIETGDLGYIDMEGLIYLRGRIDDMIVSGGENVYPLELENILLQHPDVDQAVVLGIEDPDFGQRLRAIVQPQKDSAVNCEELMSWLKQRATRYQMPKIIEFKEIAFSELGKVNKNNLIQN